jgi:hypothetical protein
VGGGGGGGGGHGGLGGRHAPKDIKEVLPRKLHGVADEATRCVASRPPRPRPPSAGAYKEQAAPPTIFKVVYDRGDLPIRVNGGVAKYVRWAVRDVPAPDRASALSSAGALGGPEYEAARTRFLRALVAPAFNVSFPATRVVTFGGSYPGALSAWARLRLPHLVTAAVSTSSPVLASFDFLEYNAVVGRSLAQPLVGGRARAGDRGIHVAESIDMSDDAC